MIFELEKISLMNDIDNDHRMIMLHLEFEFRI